MATRRGHNEGTIRLRTDGRWEAVVSLPGGQRRSLYGKTRKEVQEKLRGALRDLEAGLDLSKGRLTVSQFLERWLSDSVKPSVKVKTWEGYESIVRVRVVPNLGSKSLDRLTSLDVQSLYSALGESGLSSLSIKHTHRVLHRAMVQAVRWNLVVRNPCDGATPPQAQRREMNVLTEEQVNVFLEATSDHPAHALYVLAITTGMRLGELLGLKWTDINMEAGKLFVNRSLQRQNDAGIVFVEPKTARSRRTIQLSQLALSALRRHKTRQNEQRLFHGPEWHDTGLVFTNLVGEAPDPGWQRQVFQKALADAGLPTIRFHDLRHTAATLLLAKGVHVKVVSEMLGHTTITLTLDTYAHSLPSMHEQAASAMDLMFSA